MKGAVFYFAEKITNFAERMLTNKIVLKVFSDYLARDTVFEAIPTGRGCTVISSGTLKPIQIYMPCSLRHGTQSCC